MRASVFLAPTNLTKAKAHQFSQVKPRPQANLKKSAEKIKPKATENRKQQPPTFLSIAS